VAKKAGETKMTDCLGRMEESELKELEALISSLIDDFGEDLTLEELREKLYDKLGL